MKKYRTYFTTFGWWPAKNNKISLSLRAIIVENTQILGSLWGFSPSKSSKNSDMINFVGIYRRIIYTYFSMRGGTHRWNSSLKCFGNVEEIANDWYRWCFRRSIFNVYCRICPITIILKVKYQVVCGGVYQNNIIFLREIIVKR